MNRRDFLRRTLAGVIGMAASRSWAASAKGVLSRVDLGFIAGEMELVRRGEWTQIAPRSWLLREGGAYDRITVHHTGGPGPRMADRTNVSLTVEGILVGHMESSYGDIGYHFAVDPDGRVWEGRSLAYEGAHVSGENAGNVGVVLLGNFEEATPGELQVAAMGKLVNLLRGKLQIKGHRVYGHRDLGQSKCPGRNLYGRVRELRG